MATVPVSIATDMTSGPTLHALYAGMIDVWDAAAPMNHAPGAAIGKHKLATNVQHRGQQIVLEGHDHGPSLPHYPMGFCLHVIRSSRRPIFSASTVRMENRPTACVHGLRFTEWLCGDPMTQTGGHNFANSAHSVLVGMTDADVLAGHVAIVLLQAFEAFEALKVMFLPEEDSKKAMLEPLTGIYGLDPVKTAQGAFLSLITSTITSYGNDWKTPIVLKLEVGPPQATQEAEISVNPRTGESHGKVEVGIAEWRPDSFGWGKPL